ncbi:MAG: hypothetical protein SGARI_001573 [Bacillariaceae sp.]
MANGNWRKPEDTLEKKVPCFVSSPQEGPIRKDYIWMPATNGLEAGYYHLRTQEAYIRVYDLICHQQAKVLKTQDDKALYNQVRQLMYLRLHCDYPSDLYAMRMDALNKSSFHWAASSIIPMPAMNTMVFRTTNGRMNQKVGFH